MKLSIKSLLPIATLSLAVFSANAQENESLRHVEPGDLRVISEQEAREAASVTATFGLAKPNAATAAASATLPVWSYSVKAAQDGKTYTGSVVGASPLGGIASTTTVPTVLVPVVLKITQGGVTYTFDPTQGDSGCLGGTNTAMSLFEASPLFVSTDIVLNGVNQGTTQYIDAVQRSEFYALGTSGYHLLLSPTVGATLTISVNASSRGNSTAEVYSVGGTQCGTNTNNINGHAKLGIININTIDAQLQNYITAHGLNQSQLPYFLIYNSVISNGSANNLNNCCILGYHNALSNGQTYGIAEFEGRFNTVFTNTGDISVSAHELGEWANDPFGNNPTPAWGNIGQVSGCQSNFEVGDPLSGTLAPSLSVGGFTYHPQELAFYSWFYGGTSIGSGGVYSTNGTFKGFAKSCPPGGTN